MQWAWTGCRGTVVERTVIESATVRTGVALINLFTPEVRARAVGASIVAQGGGINVRSGCEGTELLFPLLSGIMVVRLSWKLRAVGVLAGALLVFILNQARLLALFYSFRADPVLFGQIHGVLGPLVLVLVLIAFFLLILRVQRRHGGAIE